MSPGRIPIGAHGRAKCSKSVNSFFYDISDYNFKTLWLFEEGSEKSKTVHETEMNVSFETRVQNYTREFRGLKVKLRFLDIDSSLF